MNRMLGLGAVIVASVCLVAPASLACKNAIHRVNDTDIQMLVKAEAALRAGTHLRPIALSVTSRFKSLRYQGPSAGKGNKHGKLRRALAVMAVIAIRSNGEYAPDGIRVRSAKRKQRHLAWATKTLENLVKVRPADNRYKARWAEALMAHGNHKQAIAMLKKLDAKDLMPDARSYQTLALALAAAGDTTSSKRAQAVCKQRSKRWSVCALPGDKAPWEVEDEKEKKKVKGKRVS